VNEKKLRFADSKMGGGIFIKSNKNAFTLIELLAIIVILAIIAVITVPIILNIIDNSKKGAATDSAYGYKDAVNKAYIQELAKPNNGNLKLDGTYVVQSDGTLNADTGSNFGVTNYTNLPVSVSGDKPSSGKLGYSNNVLNAGCLVIGDYKVTFDGNTTSTTKGDCDDFVINSGSSSTVEPLEIGTDVDYVTSLNGVTLDDWKVFYTEGNFTYLIYGDYLPNSAIDISSLAGIIRYGAYAVTTEDKEIINILTTTSNWTDLLSGTINGSSVNETKNSSSWAIGSPTLDLLLNSWNSNDGYTPLSYNPLDARSLNLSQGFGNPLYFPRPGGVADSFGYWISSYGGDPGNEWPLNISDYNGYLGNNECGWSDYFALRPVIKLPTSILNQ
jgi:type IV pilus assembly protein PilA